MIGNTRKVSKIETTLSKIEKTWKLGHLCCQIREKLSHFLCQTMFRIPYCFNLQVYGSSIPQKYLTIEQKVGLFCQKTCFWILM